MLVKLSEKTMGKHEVTSKVLWSSGRVQFVGYFPSVSLNLRLDRRGFEKTIFESPKVSFQVGCFLIFTLFFIT